MPSKKSKENIVEKVKLETTSQQAFKQRNYFSILVLSFAIISFTILTFFVKTNPYFPIDLVITRFIQSIHLQWFDMLMAALTYIGETVQGTILVILAAIALFIFKRYKEAGMTIFSSASMTVVGILMKRLVGRARPSPMLIHQIGRFIKNDSFPSGHVLFYVGFFGFLLFLSFTLLKKSIIRTGIMSILLILISLIGISRIYRGAHWFSDVMGAYLLGFIWLSFVMYIYRRLQPKVKVQ